MPDVLHVLLMRLSSQKNKLGSNWSVQWLICTAIAARKVLKQERQIHYSCRPSIPSHYLDIFLFIPLCDYVRRSIFSTSATRAFNLDVAMSEREAASDLNSFTSVP